MSAGPTTSHDEESPTSPKVLVVGSLHYDIMVDAPDRPRKGETVTGRSWAPKFGGKGGNQAAAARRQGAATAMVGAVGRDDFGKALLAGLDRASVERTGVLVQDGVGSGMSVAIFDNDGDYGAVIVSGANLTIEPAQVSDDLLRRAEVVVLQNEIPEAVNEAIAKRARDHGVLTILNAAPAKPFTTTLPSYIDLLVVNAIEAEMLGGGTVSSLADASSAALLLAGHYQAVIVTAGGDGVAYCDRKGRRISLPGVPIVVASTHGAGDTFVGTLAACYAEGHGPEVALDCANRAAAALVATPESER